MGGSCDHVCSQCQKECESRMVNPKESMNECSKIGKVIGVVSGKGGVGKSLVTSLLAVSMQRNGFQTAILDADITGPSIPGAFGIHQRAQSCEDGFLPVTSQNGVKIVSTNNLLENEDDPVITRGPLLANAVKQYWRDFVWGKVDYLFVDMPPGTGDVPLTVLNSLPVDGVVIVTSPQELVQMIVRKSLKMAERIGVPVRGIVLNMAYFECPTCHDRHYIFGGISEKEIAKNSGVSRVVSIPIDPEIALACDRGEIESLRKDWMCELAELIADEKAEMSLHT